MPQAIFDSIASRYDWESPAGRRVILYFSMRKATTWPAWMAWQVSRRWVEDTDR